VAYGGLSVTAGTMGVVGRKKKRRSLAARFEDRIGRTGDGSHVPFLTSGGVALTAVGVGGGLLTDADGLVSNVFANLVLIGPALVISNIVVAYVQRARSRRRAAWHMAVIVALLSISVKVANDFLAMLGSEVRCSTPEVFTLDGIPDLHVLADALYEASKAVELEVKKYANEAGENPKIWMPIKGDVLALPNFAAVQTVVTQLDREIPCSDALLSASAAEQFSRFGYIDFVFHPPSPPIFGPSPGMAEYIREPKIGFGEISVWMERAMLRSDDHITVGIASYDEFVRQCLFRSQNITRDIIGIAPDGSIAQPEGSATGPTPKEEAATA
jgi:hypothetical protein